MKLTNLIVPVIFLSAIAISCNSAEETELSKLIASRTDLEVRIMSLEDSVDLLDVLIDKLDTTEKNFSLVRLDTVRNSFISEDAMFQGSVEASQSIVLSPEMSGVVRSLRVKEGQRVNSGSVLATLDAQILYKNIAEIEKSLELAEYMLQKQQNLKDQGIGTEASLVQAKNQKESLETRVASLKAQAAKSTVIAPFSGYVDQIFTKLGEIGSPQVPMLRLVNLDKVVVKAEVSEAYLMDIQPGDKVTLTFPSINKTVTSKVTSVGKFINPTNRTFPIQIEVNNSDKSILPNLIAEVKVEKDFTQDAILIPSESILEDNKGATFVYINENGKAKKKSIVKLYVKGAVTQIAKESEVKVGDIIITSGASALIDGDAVKELKN